LSGVPRAVIAAAWWSAAALAFLAAATTPVGTAAALALGAGATSLGLSALAFGGALLSAGSPARRLGWVRSELPAGVIVGLVLGLLAVSQLAEWAIAWAGYQEAGNLAEFRRRIAGVSGAPLAFSLLGLAVLPGFGEELALRGWIQRGLEPRWGAPRAVVASSLLFALLHGEPIHASAAFFLGLYLGSVVALSGSIRPAVLCHVLNNAVATLGVALGRETAAGAVVLLGFVAGPWALRRLWLRHQAARPALGSTPEAPRQDPPPPPPA
jgi:membrane protease YdiL (CAAX protease family)